MWKCVCVYVTVEVVHSFSCYDKNSALSGLQGQQPRPAK